MLQAKKAKQAEIDRKRAEVRRRMEEASKAKKAKKGFMTPERKKKLRVSVSLDIVVDSKLCWVRWKLCKGLKRLLKISRIIKPLLK